MNLKVFFLNHYVPNRLRDCSPNTTRLYGCTLRSFGKYLAREAELTDLTDETLSGFLLKRADSVSPETCRKEFDQLTSLWRYANRKQYLSTWPDLLAPRTPRHNPQSLTLIQLRAFQICADDFSYEMGQIVRLAWETGERKTALLSLRGADVRGTWVVFRAATRKGASEDNACEISDSLAESLDVLLDRNKFLFTQRSTWHTSFRTVAERAGLRGKRLGFHMLRRSAASHLSAAGGNACDFLGHAKEETTKRWYLDKRITQQGNAACNLLPDISTPNG